MKRAIKEIIGVFTVILTLMAAYNLFYLTPQIPSWESFLSTHQWLIYVILILLIAIGSYGLHLAQSQQEQKTDIDINHKHNEEIER